MTIRTNYIENAFPQINIVCKDAMPVLERYGFTTRDIINLCGGIPAPQMTNIRVTIAATYSSALSVQICTDQHEVARNIDFEIARIDNNYMYVNEKRQGLGTNLFLTQVRAALLHKFGKIHLTAMGPEDGLDWNGYYFWALLGFENTDIAEYQSWAKAMGRKEPTLSELVQTQSGRTLWKNTGFTWIGNFYPTMGHPCMAYLQKHLHRKKIDFYLDV
ncbi:MAG TPA: hypothetical protein VG101_06820 [Puia sp.]|nr:hypothetical protein [Puia sp.]